MPSDKHPNPAIGNPDWERWYESLSPNDRLAYLEKLDESFYPGAPGRGDWKNVSVSKGPGTGKGDVLRCKVLSNYKPLLQVASRIGVVGLSFHNFRDKNSMLTTIWASNAKRAIVVDWEIEAVMPGDPDAMHGGFGLCPEIVENGYHVTGNNGNIVLSTKKGAESYPWKDGYRAYPLIVSSESPLAFAVAWNKSTDPRTLDSVVCFNVEPIELLGEVKMPESTSTVWMLFDKDCNMLLVADHDWEWISMIDLGSLNQNQK
jgi:hypothetical protein